MADRSPMRFGRLFQENRLWPSIDVGRLTPASVIDSRQLSAYTRFMCSDPVDFTACRTCTCTAIRRASRAITHHYDEALRDTGLRNTQFTLLATLVQTGPIPMTRLAAFLSLERTTLTRNLKSLLRDGLVEVAGARRMAASGKSPSRQRAKRRRARPSRSGKRRRTAQRRSP